MQSPPSQNATALPDQVNTNATQRLFMALRPTLLAAKASFDTAISNLIGALHTLEVSEDAIVARGRNDRLPEPAPESDGEALFDDVIDIDEDVERGEITDLEPIVYSYLASIRNVAALSPADERKYILAAQAGNPDATNRIVASYLTLVPPIARMYVGRGLDLDDLIEEGNLGIYKALPKFDLELGFQFSTYAKWWIKEAIHGAILNHGRVVRLPVHIVKALTRARKQLGLAVGDNKFKRRGSADAASNVSPLSLEEAKKLVELAELPLSLDAPVNDGSLIDTIEATTDDPAARLHRQERSQIIFKLISNLGPNEQRVIRHRFGFDESGVDSLEAIGAELGLSAERVRQIQNQALKRMQAELSRRNISLAELLWDRT